MPTMATSHRQPPVPPNAGVNLGAEIAIKETGTSTTSGTGSAPNASTSSAPAPAPPAHGSRAASDCFTCAALPASRRTAEPCDRGRPYCAVCLRTGRACAGYKTTLTWGVGVASRGKLRGRAVPVWPPAKGQGKGKGDKATGKSGSGSGARIKEGSKKTTNSGMTTAVGASTSTSATAGSRIGMGVGSGTGAGIRKQERRPRNDSGGGKSIDVARLETLVEEHTKGIDREGQSGNTGGAGQGDSYTELTAAIKAVTNPPEWSAYADRFQRYDRADRYAPLPTPAGSLSPEIDQYQMLLLQQQQQHQQQQQQQQQHQRQWGQHLGQQQTLPYLWQAELPVYGGMGVSYGYVPYEEQDISHPIQPGAYEWYNGPWDWTPAPATTTSTMPFPAMAAALSPSIPPPLFTAPIGRTPRMRHLIRYFSEAVAPAMVTLASADPWHNPFRTLVLELARSSQTVQHAVAALAAANLRQRRENSEELARIRRAAAVRAARAQAIKGAAEAGAGPGALSAPPLSQVSGRVSFAVRTLEAEEVVDDGEQAELTPYGYGAASGPAFGPGFGRAPERAREEQAHRRAAVARLNAELADPAQRLDDSVLVTLLLLCLFHVCDTGFGQFRRQFEGVRKLLTLRGVGDRGRGNRSDVARWCARMFVWFDTMTATVNGRDAELGGDLLAVLPPDDDGLSIESLTGCERRLFGLVTQLSRLNWQQQRRARTMAASMAEMAETTRMPGMRAPWMSMPVPGMRPAGPMSGSGSGVSGGSSGPGGPGANAARAQATFWRDWWALRRKLEAWPLNDDTTAGSSSSSGSGAMTANVTATSLGSVGSGPAATGGTSVFPGLPSPPLGSSATLSPAASASSAASMSPVATDAIDAVDMNNISESFRHAALLFLDRLALPATARSDTPTLQARVAIALSFIARVQSDVSLLWPLFVVGAECTRPEHRAIIRERCGGIQEGSGFVNNLTCLRLLERIWIRHDREVAAVAASGGEVEGGGSGDGGTSSATTSGALTMTPAGGGFRWQCVIAEQGLDGEYIVV